MGLISLTCPACGAKLENLDDSREFFFCPYCGNRTTFDRTIVEHRGAVDLRGVANESTLLERAKNYLSDGDFTEAKSYFDRVLDINPRSAAAYMGLVACKHSARRVEDLEKDYSAEFSEDSNYRRALEYSVGDEHARYAGINGPAHLYRVGVSRIDSDREKGKAALARKHADLLTSLRTRIASLESNIAYANTSIANSRTSYSRQKRRYNGRVIKGLIAPIVLLIASVLVTLLTLNTGIVWLLLVALTFFLMAIVGTVSAFTRNKFHRPTVEAASLRGAIERQRSDQAELAQTRATLAQCEVSTRNEMNQFLAASDAELATFKREFALKYPGVSLGS